jgi:hypothetical protein
MLEHHTRCAPGSNDSSVAASTAHYKYVVAVQNPKSRHFYHFMTETISRLFLVSDLLQQHPDMKIAGLQGKKFAHLSQDALSLMGLEAGRLVASGCAEYLIIPESAKCEGLDVAMLHVIRAYIRKALRPLRAPAAAPQGECNFHAPCNQPSRSRSQSWSRSWSRDIYFCKNEKSQTPKRNPSPSPTRGPGLRAHTCTHTEAQFDSVDRNRSKCLSLLHRSMVPLAFFLNEERVISAMQ